MKLNDCARLLSAKVIVPIENMDMDIQVACGSDLMSDVMAFSCCLYAGKYRISSCVIWH